MTGMCQLCGRMVENNYVQPEENEHYRAIAFDRLAAYMWLHISQDHPNQAAEGTLQMQRAAKLYALNWTTLPEDVKEEAIAWRTEFVTRLSHTTALQTDFAEDRRFGGATGSGSGSASTSSSDVPSGSNVKKSERNSSN